MLTESEAAGLVTDHFRAVVARPVPGGLNDPELCKVFHMAEADLDGDGVVETCVVGGVPSPMSAASALLIVREHGAARDVVPVVPMGWGWQALELADIDSDGRVEIWSTWKAGSGAFLDVLVHRWDGRQVSVAMRHQGANQGAVERKNFDGTPADDIVVWKSVGDGQAGPWLRPLRYILTVYRWAAGNWSPAAVHPTVRRYMPGHIAGARTGPVNMPADMGRHLVPLEEDRALLDRALTNGDIEAAVDDVGRRVQLFLDADQPEEAYRRSELLVAALDRLPPTRPWGVMIHSQRAHVLARLGRLGKARKEFQEALAWLPASEERGATACSLHRAEGMFAAIMGDFEDALVILQGALEKIPAPAAEDPDLRSEHAKLLSNIALARYWAGDLKTSEAGFREVVALEQANGNTDGEVVNRTLLGNALRDGGRPGGALEQYDAALAALDERSERNRESDVLAERGATLLALERPVDALIDARNAVLLSSAANYAFGAGHHLIIHAEALAACGMSEAARAAATMCYEYADRWQSIDLAWRSALLAARTTAGGEPSTQRTWLNRALKAVESLRGQTLPEPLRIALATGREQVYEELVTADYRADDGVAALAHMEAAKSRVLVELLAGTPLPPPPAPEHLLDHERRLLGRLRELEGHRVAQVLGLEPPDSGERLAKARAELAEARAELEQVWEALEASGPRAAEYVTLRRGGPPKLADLATLLRS